MLLASFVTTCTFGQTFFGGVCLSLEDHRHPNVDLQLIQASSKERFLPSTNTVIQGRFCTSRHHPLIPQQGQIKRNAPIKGGTLVVRTPLLCLKTALSTPVKPSLQYLQDGNLCASLRPRVGTSPSFISAASICEGVTGNM